MKLSLPRPLFCIAMTTLLFSTAAAIPRAQKKEPAVKAGAYSAPRWPSYLQKPKSVDDIMPHARDLVRNKAGFGGNSPGLGLGLLQQGEEVMIVPDTTAEDFVVEALMKALAERGVQAHIVPNYSLVGVSKEDAEEIRRKTEIRSAEEGFMEAKYYWIERVFAHPEVPKTWLKQKNPDLYDALYPRRDKMTPEMSVEWKKLSNESVGAAIRDYLQQRPKIKGVYWGHPGGAFYARTMAPLEGKYLGRCSFTNSWEVVSEVSSFPADVWQLIEKKSIAMLTPDVDKVEVTDPEGTNVTWNVTEEMAKRWMRGIYWRGHLLMYPDSATGQYGQDFDNYPKTYPEWIDRSPTAKANGVIAGTNGSGGFWPRMEVHLKDGAITEVKGGGRYGDVIRLFQQYPHINDTAYPHYDTPGYWHLWEVAVGTNPKYFRNPTDFYGGGTAGVYCLTYERYRSGAFHWGLGNELGHDPGSKGTPKQWKAFAEKLNLPDGHDFHIQNYFITYKVHRKTTGNWVTIVHRGHLVALDDPDVRALAAKYGDPNKLLAEDWIPDIPGINVPGNYQEYARDPWKYANARMQRILHGDFSYGEITQ